MLTFLFVCTGNICRSPLAEAFMADRSRRLLDGRVRVCSAGTWAGEGNAPMGESLLVLRDLGIEPPPGGSTPLHEDLIDEADLIVTMTEEQLEAVGLLAPDAAARAFTLKELAVLLAALPPVVATDDDDVRARLAAADLLRGGRNAPRIGDANVRDPIGLGMRVYRHVAGEIEDAMDVVVGGLFGVGALREAERT